jgi:hypothetical protein
MYVDKLDSRIDNSFYSRMSETWQVEQNELLREIARHQAVDRSYLDEGARGAVARLVGIEVGVVSGVFNLESPGVSALGWRLRHEEAYHAD